MENKQIYAILLLWTVVYYLDLVGGSRLNQDLILTSSQKIKLDKLKRLVEHWFDPEDDYKTQEIYLVKWLRGANFEPQLAAQKIKADIQWREEMKMDSIHDEDWADFPSRFEYKVEGVDKSGQPFLIGPMGSWDIRQAMVAGQRAQVERYIFKMLEDTAAAVRQQYANGTIVTRANAVFDVAGFSMAQHGCISCISMYLVFGAAMDSHFPELFDKLIIINTPSIFEVVLDLIKPMFPEELRESIFIFGTNKRDRQEFFHDIANEGQLPGELWEPKSKIV